MTFIKELSQAMKEDRINLLKYVLAGAVGFGIGFALSVAIVGIEGSRYIGEDISNIAVITRNITNIAICCAITGAIGGGTLGVISKGKKRIWQSALAGAIGFGFGAVIGYIAGIVTWLMLSGLIVLVLFAPIRGIFIIIPLVIAALFAIAVTASCAITGAIGGGTLGVISKGKKRIWQSALAGAIGFGMGAIIVLVILFVAQSWTGYAKVGVMWFTIMSAFGGVALGYERYLAEK